MNRLLFILTLTVPLSLLGCGGGTPGDQPETAAVTGKVTNGGQPVANATVKFTPDATGRPSSGITDSTGAYELLYTANTKGAMIGAHSVTVTLNESEGSSYASEDDKTKKSDALPASASDGSIKRDVKAGSNEIDIELSGS